MEKKEVNILFINAGRRVELMKAFRNALIELNVAGNLIAIDIDPLAPALKLADYTYIIPGRNDPSYIPNIISICKQHNAVYVFPLIDPDLLLLAKHRNTIESGGTKLSVIPMNSVETCVDKKLTSDFFAKIGIPAPKYWLPENVDPNHLSYPVFIKPRKGSASESTYKVKNAKELLFFCNYVENPIIQEYLPGSEITNDVFCDFEGNILGLCLRKRIEVRWGEVSKGVTIHDPQIAEYCIRIATALKAFGPITVQCIMKDNKPFFTEINPRFGGGAPLAFHVGVNAPKWYISLAAKLNLVLPEICSYEEGVYLTRYDQSFFIAKKEIESV